MMKKSVLSILLSASALLVRASVPSDLEAITVHEQEEAQVDVGMKVGASVTKKLTKGLSLTLEEKVSLNHNFTRFSKSETELKFSYKPVSHLKLDLAYDFLATNKEGSKKSNYEDYWTLRHRLKFGVTGSYKVGSIKLSLREKLQTTFRNKQMIIDGDWVSDEFDTMEKVGVSLKLYSRLKAEWSMRRVPIKPYVSVELGNTLNTPLPINNYITDVKSALGVVWSINAHNSFDFYFRYAYNIGKDVNVKYNDSGAIRKIKVVDEYMHTNQFGIMYKYNFK